MSEFIEAVALYPFMRNALLAGVLLSITCGVIGSYVVVKRITYMAGSIAHCVLGGIGFARYLQVVHGMEFATPFLGAVAAALAAALIIGMVSLKAKQREDTVIGALWAVGMAAGVLFISMTPGYSQDLMSYLFGNILMVSRSDLVLIAVLDIVVAGTGLLFFHKFTAVCFDEEFARIRGINTAFYYLLLLCLTALTVVLLSTIVGIIMVIALLTIPAATANLFAKTLGTIMLISVGLSALFTVSGLALSYTPNLPAGATIILIAGSAYILCIVFRAAAQSVSTRLKKRDLP